MEVCICRIKLVSFWRWPVLPILLGCRTDSYTVSRMRNDIGAIVVEDVSLIAVAMFKQHSLTLHAPARQAIGIRTIFFNHLTHQGHQQRIRFPSGGDDDFPGFDHSTIGQRNAPSLGIEGRNLNSFPQFAMFTNERAQRRQIGARVYPCRQFVMHRAKRRIGLGQPPSGQRLRQRRFQQFHGMTRPVLPRPIDASLDVRQCLLIANRYQPPATAETAFHTGISLQRLYRLTDCAQRFELKLLLGVPAIRHVGHQRTEKTTRRTSTQLALFQHNNGFSGLNCPPRGPHSENSCTNNHRIGIADGSH